MKRWIVVSGLAALLAAILLTAFAFTGSEPVSTEDIDAIYDHTNRRLDAASFVPGIPREEVVQGALEDAGNVLGGADTSNLETRTTVACTPGRTTEATP